jgi:alpha,alpha-trehalose phosphorylase
LLSKFDALLASQEKFAEDPGIAGHADGAAAATWMMLTYGFGGMRDEDGTLSFWPRRAPEENATLRFPITYRGQLLEVEIGHDTVEYVLREGERLAIRHEKEELQLTRENPRAIRPVSKR